MIKVARKNSATAALSALSLNPPGGGLSRVVDDETKKFLECPVCLDVAKPPIYNCQTGHVICHECKGKLKECPLCKSQYTNSRNFPLEALVQSSKFYCDHRHKGCEESGSMDELIKHHQECQLRPIKCHLAPLHDCMGDLHYLTDYAKHLENFHKLASVGPKSTFCTNDTLPDYNTNLETNYTWCGSLLKYDGNVFVSLIRNRGLIFHIGFFLIGDELDAIKYNVKIILEKPTRAYKYVVTTSIPSIRDFQEDGQNEDPNLPTGVVVHKRFLESIGEVIKAAAGTSKLVWRVQYEILKLETN